MFYGDLATLVPSGIKIHASSLYPIGIYNQSICWGMHVARVPGTDPSPKSPHHEGLYGRQLVIAPFHPVTWPYLLRFEVKLHHRTGALARIASVMQQRGVSFLHSESTTTGFTHATWNAIGEVLPIRAKYQTVKEDLDASFPETRHQGTQGFERAREFANALAADMFDQARSLEKEIVALSETEDNVLHPRIARNEWHLFDESMLSTENRALWKRERPRVARVAWLQNLPYFAIYGGGPDNPVQFRYDEETAKLSMTDRRVVRPGLGFDDTDLPTLGLSSFDTSEKYVRIRHVPQHLLSRRIISIDLDYQVFSLPRTSWRGNVIGGSGRGGNPAEAIEMDSSGLLALTTDLLGAARVNLLHTSNQTLEAGYSSEQGRIRLIGESSTPLAGHVRSGLAYGLSELRVDEAKTGRPRARITDVSVKTLGVRQLFVSMRFGHPRDEDLRSVVMDVAADAGFEAQIIRRYAARATESISESISSASAVLQILTFRADDDPDNVSFSWLNFEYGLSIGNNLPTLRLVDTVRRDMPWWRNRISTDADRHMKEFRTDVSDGELRVVLRAAMDELFRVAVEEEHRGRHREG